MLSGIRHIILVCLVLGRRGVPAWAEALPKHLEDAKNLLKHLSLKHTSYRHGPSQIAWTGRRQSHADCSGFLDALLMHRAGTTQWAVTVIDSSRSGHGFSDSRHAHGRGGKDHDGLGQGMVRLYADRYGRVVGFSWSTLRRWAFKGPGDEHLVIGRLASD